MTHVAGSHSRSFHLHVSQQSNEPERLRWSVTRTVWATGRPAQSALLEEGELRHAHDHNEMRQVAGELLDAALAAYAGTVWPSGPGTAGGTIALCECGKPASHVDSDPDGNDWACRVGY